MKKIVLVAFVVTMLLACVDTSDLPKINNLTSLNDSIQKALVLCFSLQSIFLTIMVCLNIEFELRITSQMLD